MSNTTSTHSSGCKTRTRHSKRSSLATWSQTRSASRLCSRAHRTSCRARGPRRSRPAGSSRGPPRVRPARSRSRDLPRRARHPRDRAAEARQVRRGRRGITARTSPLSTRTRSWFSCATPSRTSYARASIPRTHRLASRTLPPAQPTAWRRSRRPDRPTHSARTCHHSTSSKLRSKSIG